MKSLWDLYKDIWNQRQNNSNGNNFAIKGISVKLKRFQKNEVFTCETLIHIYQSYHV